MFISFEGVDGSGKTTQIALLKRYLEEKAIPNLITREPGGTNLAEQIREILLYTKDEINPISELMLFAAARSQHISTIIKPAINENKIVITDRFYDSTTAYQGYGRGIDLGIVKQLNSIAVGQYHPNITFYLQISLEESLQRRHRQHKDRMEASGEHFLQNVITGYNQIAISEPKRVITIDGNLNVEEIHTLILQKIRTLV